jgi:two-component system chemotaxis response regulator CheV
MATSDNKGILLESGTNELEIIELFIDEEGGYRGYYGVNVAKVIEIISMPINVHKPPNAAKFIAGVFNHRDKVIVLVDLALWLGKNRSKENPPIVIITEFNNVTSAFLVSGVTRIHRTSWADIKPLDIYLQRFSEAITGMILLENKTVLMLDLERVISELDPRPAAPKLQEGIDDVVASEAPAIATKRPLKVLHADDSGMIRRTTKQLLEEKKEFIVTSVVDGREAWESLEDLKKKAVAENKPVTDFLDVVLSDIEMPGMDGYHLCQKVKSDADLMMLPVILFSSLITDKLRHKGESVGADGQLSKPSPAALVRDLKEIVAKRMI